MASSTAATPEQYLAELEPGRAALIGAVRDLVNSALPEGYVETVAWGMLTWSIPLDRYPDTYNRQPLALAALAAQKNYNSLYLNCAYASAERSERLRAAFAAEGKKLDMGKSCIRFRKLDDLALDAIAAEIASTPPDDYIALYERARAR